jgi:hypothetical protein
MNYDIWPKVSKGLSQPTDLFQSPHGDLVQESQPWTSVSRCPRCLSPRRCDAWWWFHFGDGTTQIFYSYTVCVYSMYMYILYYIYTDWWLLEPWNFEWLPFSWECHHPNWRSPSFFRGVGQPPIRYIYIYIWSWVNTMNPNQHHLTSVRAACHPCSKRIQADVLPNTSCSMTLINKILVSSLLVRFRLEIQPEIPTWYLR